LLTVRQQKMVHQLIEKGDYIRVEDFKEEFQISDRTVRHDLLLLEGWLGPFHVQLERNRKYGVRLVFSEQQNTNLVEILQKQPEFKDHKERVKVIKKLLLEDSVINVLDLQEEMAVSKNTLAQDIQIVRDWLHEKKLDLVRKKGLVELVGDEQSVRRAYLELLREEFSEQKIFQLLIREESALLTPWEKWFPLEEIFELCDVLQLLEKRLDIQFSDTGFSALTLHLLMAVQRLKDGHLIKMDEQLLTELKNIPEFAIIKDTIKTNLFDIFQIDTPDQEIGYITQHVLGAQRNHEYLQEDAFYINFSKKIVSNMEDWLHHPLVEREKVIQGLAIHLKPAFYRAKYHLQSENPLLHQLEMMYGPIIDRLEEDINQLVSPMGISFDRHEISYIALHICSGLDQKVIPLKLRVAVVCSSGLGTSALLERKITMLYPQVTIIKKYSYMEVKSISTLDVDLLLSTIEIPFMLPVPVVYVSPLLPKEDQKKLIPYIGEPRNPLQEEGKLVQVVKDVLTIFQKHSTVENEAKIRTELLEYFQGQNGKQEKKRLTEFLSPEAILLQEEIADWKLAVLKGNELLAKMNCTDSRFGETLVEMAEQPNTHFVIADGVAFPHGGSDRHVYQTGFSLITLKNEIIFGGTRQKVWFIITLAAVNQHQHTHALATLIDCLADQEFMEYLRTANNPEEVWRKLLEKEAMEG
jgi:mannitol operon transcriptional antiterminator